MFQHQIGSNSKKNVRWPIKFSPKPAKKRLNKSWGLSLILTRKSLPSTNFHHQHHRSSSSSNHTIEWLSNQNNEEEFQQKIQHILKDILFFEPIDPDLIRKKRPVSEVSSPRSDITPNTLAEQLDETLSAKRRRIDDETYAMTPTMDQDDETKMIDPKDKCFFQILYRTWQDRRRIKRSIDHENNGMPIFEREQLISSKLKEETDHQLKTPLHLSMETKLAPLLNETSQRQAQVYLKLQTNDQHQLFVDLGHFLALYLPKMMENQ